MEIEEKGIDPGTVYWITGLAGAGKTTIAKGLYTRFRMETDGVVLLDGDDLRQSVAEDLGYTREDRYKAAMRYGRLCSMLARQSITVVIGTISMFHDVRRWNRENIESYCEVFLDVPMEVLRKRNQKNLYSEQDGPSSVVGVDLGMEAPVNPDIHLINDGTLSVGECVERIRAWKR